MLKPPCPPCPPPPPPRQGVCNSHELTQGPGPGASMPCAGTEGGAAGAAGATADPETPRAETARTR